MKTYVSDTAGAQYLLSVKMSLNVQCVTCATVIGVSGDVMLVGDDRKRFSAVGGPASDAVRYQLIDVGDNETTSDVWASRRGAVVGVNQSPVEDRNHAATKPPKSVVSTSSSTSALRHTPGSVNISPPRNAVQNHEVRINTTSTKSRLRLETALKSRPDSVSGDNVTTRSTYHETGQFVTPETLSSVLATALQTTDNTVDNGDGKLHLLLTISGENRLRGGSLNRSLDVNASAVTVSGSREQHDQSASTTRLPEVNSTTESRLENRTDVWNVEELSDSTRSTAVRVRYVHTLLTERDDVGAKTQLRASEVASIAAACAFCLFVVVAVIVGTVYRRRRTSGRTKVAAGSDDRKAGAGSEKLKALRRVAAEADTLSPDLLDQIIRAELARGRAKRYRARLRDGDDREQLERLAVELSDDWGTPPPSYRRLTPVSGPAHRRPLWPADSPARVHDVRPPIPELPPPIPQRSSAKPTVVPLDFRQFRRPLPEVPRNEPAADRHELVPRSFAPQLLNTTTVRCDGPRCDVIAASPQRIMRDVIRSPLPVAACAQDGGTGSSNKRRERRRDVITRSCDVTAASPCLACDVIKSPLPFSGHIQDGGTGSEQRRRFPKMGRSCLLDSLRQRGDCSVAGQCPTSSHGPRAADLRHPAVTSWTRDLSHLPILRDTTV